MSIDETKSYEEYMKSKLSAEEIAALDAEVSKQVEVEGYDNPMVMSEEELAEDLKAKAAGLAQQKLVAEEYRLFVGGLKKKLKSNSKNQLVEIIANQAWQFNQLQQMARQIHEKNIELEAKLQPKGDSNA